MAKKVKVNSNYGLNSGHWLEAADRCHNVCEIIQFMLLEHPAIEQSAELSQKILEAQALIAEAYQDCGKNF